MNNGGTDVIEPKAAVAIGMVEIEDSRCKVLQDERWEKLVPQKTRQEVTARIFYEYQDLYRTYGGPAVTKIGELVVTELQRMGVDPLDDSTSHFRGHFANRMENYIFETYGEDVAV